MSYRLIVAGLCVLFLAACDSDLQNAGLPVPEAPQRQYDVKQLALGEKVFKENCAECHGESAQGEPDWKQRGTDGRYPAPPLNGTAHAWHHSNDVLDDIVRNGSPDENSRMTAWQGKLSDQEIAAVIIWFQSTWPKAVYDAWYEMNRSEY